MTAATQTRESIQTYIDPVNPQWARLLNLLQMQTEYTVCSGGETLHRSTEERSSASVLCVLDEVMKCNRPQTDAFSILRTAGPGFCFELALLKWPQPQTQMYS